MFFNGQHVKNVPASAWNLFKKNINRQTNCLFLPIFGPPRLERAIYLDQGGELFNHPKVQNMFKKKKDYDILPTGADNSHQNSPVAQGHLTLANTIRALLVGTNLDLKFWPFAFIMLWACPMYSLNMVLLYPQSAWQQQSEKISPISKLLAVEYGFALLGIVLQNSNQICVSVYSLDMFPSPLEIYYGTTQKHPRFRLQHMLVLTRGCMISQSLKCLQMLITLSVPMMDNLFPQILLS